METLRNGGGGGLFGGGRGGGATVGRPEGQLYGDYTVPFLINRMCTLRVHIREYYSLYIPIGLPLTGGAALELIASCDWYWDDGGARIVPKWFCEG